MTIACAIILVSWGESCQSLLLAWLFSDRWNIVWDSWVIPLLGFIFLPYTTIMYALVWNIASGVSGWDWLWIGLGLVLDLMKWGMIGNNRREIPGYPESAY